MSIIAKIKVGYNWTIAEVDYEFGRYLRSLFSLQSYSVCKLQKPSHGEHITIISEHEPISDKRRKVLLTFNNKIVQFTPSFDIQTNGNAFWIPIQSKDIEEIRLTVGLPKQPFISLHFCVGYADSGPLGEKP